MHDTRAAGSGGWGGQGAGWETETWTRRRAHTSTQGPPTTKSATGPSNSSTYHGVGEGPLHEPVHPRGVVLVCFLLTAIVNHRTGGKVGGGGGRKEVRVHPGGKKASGKEALSIGCQQLIHGTTPDIRTCGRTSTPTHHNVHGQGGKVATHVGQQLRESEQVAQALKGEAVVAGGKKPPQKWCVCWGGGGGKEGAHKDKRTSHTCSTTHTRAQNVTKPPNVLLPLPRLHQDEDSTLPISMGSAQDLLKVLVPLCVLNAQDVRNLAQRRQEDRVT